MYASFPHTQSYGHGAAMFAGASREIFSRERTIYSESSAPT